MKKIFAIALSLLLLVGCQSAQKFVEMTPQQQYNSLLKSVDNAKSMEVDLTMSFQTVAQGEQLFDQSITMKMKGENLRNPKTAKLEMRMEMMEFPMTLYVADGFGYMEILGQKMKVPMPQDELEDVVEQSKGLELDEADYLKNLTSEVVNDQVILSFDLPSEELNDLMENAMENTWMDSLEADVHYAYDNIVGQITASRDGELQEMKINCDMTVNLMGETALIHMEVKAEYRNLNKTQVILPTDLDTYPQTK